MNTACTFYMSQIIQFTTFVVDHFPAVIRLKSEQVNVCHFDKH